MKLFERILAECYKFNLVDPTEVFVDATHVKARANNKKIQKKIAHEEALFYEKMLQEEINTDRKEHGKKELKVKNSDDDDTPNPPSVNSKERTIKESVTDPESGWFHKGEHKQEKLLGNATPCEIF